jgi:hypothetical protein
MIDIAFVEQSIDSFLRLSTGLDCAINIRWNCLRETTIGILIKKME